MSYTVLVAEDEAPLADALTDLLEDEGYRVRRVNDGEAALKEVEAVRPDLVISDISMPRVDGVQVARRVLGMRPSIPVILMSARKLPEKLPGVMYVAKPFEIDHLLKLAERALAGHSQSTRPLP
jgi:two-component system, OmpR family, response regulator MprA